MTLTRRLALLIAALLLPALLGSLAVHTVTARDALQQQLAVRNADAAAALAVAMSQLRGDAAAMQTVASALFDLGHYGSLSLTTPDGRTLLALQSGARAAQAPPWFQRALPLQASPGTALVSDGWQDIGSLQLQAHATWANDALWRALRRTALLLLGLGLLAAVWAWRLLRGWQRPLQDAVAQATALEEGRFITAAESSWPELRQLTRSMNQMVQRLQRVFDAQAQRVAALQQQAQTDPVTGLPRREAFTARLGELLAAVGGSGHPGASLLLLRVGPLPAVNEALGHQGTDQWLGAVAEVLQNYEQRVVGSFAGRLSGCDFALCLPVAGLAQETGRSLLGALAASPLARQLGLQLDVGAVDGLQSGSAGAALAAADAALAAAQTGQAATPALSLPPHTRLAVLSPDDFVADPSGARAWRQQIVAALAQRRVRLGAFPVRDGSGALLHLECPLRIQLDPGGEHHIARRWLALAARWRLLAEVDALALELALQAIAGDGVPRGVHLSAAALGSVGYRTRLLAQLAASPDAAGRLWLDLAEDVLPLLRDPACGAVMQTLQACQRAGVRLGVEHTGGAPQLLADGAALAPSFVKVAARHLQGVASDVKVQAHAEGLVVLVQGLGAQIIAEGVDSADDLQVLWTLGFDGATGEALAPWP